MDDDLPFDELDPCCQREILDRRKEYEIRKRLNKTDRSQIRLNHIRNTLKIKTPSITCVSCAAPRDYLLLSQYRELEINKELDNKADKIEKIDDEEDDEDFDDDFESEYEKQLRDKLMQRCAMLEDKRRNGYLVHIEDSSQHIIERIQYGEYLVLHIYDPDNESCAIIDLSLEKLAVMYGFTRFRKIHMLDAGEIRSLFKINSSPADPLIVCFGNKSLKSFTNNINEITPNQEICSNDLKRFLDNSNVLFANDDPLTEVLFDASAVFETETISDDGNDESELFCNKEGCNRNYIHSHIESGSNKSSIFGIDNAGAEALSKDYFLRL
jgi:hypothetical protein